MLHVVNGPSSSEALGFTFSLNSGTEIQRWKPRLVRSLWTQLCTSFVCTRIATLDPELVSYNCVLLYKHQWNPKWAFPRNLHIFTREDNMLSSHVKGSPWLWLHNKSRLFHWCLYNKQNITCPLMDMNFIFSWSTRYLTCSLRSLVRYRVDHSKIKFISTRGHVISSISLYNFTAQWGVSIENRATWISEMKRCVTQSFGRVCRKIYTYLMIFSPFRS